MKVHGVYNKILKFNQEWKSLKFHLLSMQTQNRYKKKTHTHTYDNVHIVQIEYIVHIKKWNIWCIVIHYLHLVYLTTTKVHMISAEMKILW